eukprot:scaffold7796_cov56-Phaeocystis_antarctica.AAC.1
MGTCPTRAVSSIGGSRRLEAARGHLPRRLKRPGELVLPVGFQTPLGHRGPSLSSPGQRRALGAHRAPRRPPDQLLRGRR